MHGPPLVCVCDHVLEHPFKHIRPRLLFQHSPAFQPSDRLRRGEFLRLSARCCCVLSPEEAFRYADHPLRLVVCLRHDRDLVGDIAGKIKLFQHRQVRHVRHRHENAVLRVDADVRICRAGDSCPRFYGLVEDLLLHAVYRVLLIFDLVAVRFAEEAVLRRHIAHDHEREQLRLVIRHHDLLLRLREPGAPRAIFYHVIASPQRVRCNLIHPLHVIARRRSRRGNLIPIILRHLIAPRVHRGQFFDHAVAHTQPLQVR